MKSTILLCLALFASTILLQADNWDLFPFNQKTYYYFQTGDTETIAVYYMDYEEEIAEGILQFPLRTYVESLVSELYPLFIENQNILNPIRDVYLKSTDSEKPYAYIFNHHPDLYNPHIELFRDTLVFYPETSLGNSWEVRPNTYSSDAFPFSHLKITCVSTDFEEIVEGVIDSTKTFGIQAFDGENAIESPFDDITLKLSKNHGLVDWIAFGEWFNQYLRLDVRIVLAGFEADPGKTMGERTPLVADFFPYEAGDFLKWKYSDLIGSMNGNNTVTEIREDNITQVTKTDSIKSYLFNRKTTRTLTKKDNFTGSIDTLEFEIFEEDNMSATPHYFPQEYIDIAYWGFGFYAGSIYEDESTISVDYYDYVYLKKESSNNCGSHYRFSETQTCSSLVAYDINGETYYENPIWDINCPRKGTSYSTSFGILGTGQDYSHKSLRLIEANVSGCYFTNIKEEIYFASQITLHPNPTQNRFLLQLQNPKLQLQNLQLKITDIHGRTLQQLPVLQSTIEVDLSAQPNGIYLVQISDGTSWWTEKVVKY